MRDKHTQKLLKTIKVVAAFSMITTLYPYAQDEIGIPLRIAHANVSVLEGQNNCYTPTDRGTSDEEVSSSDDDKGKSSSGKIPNAEVLQDIYDYFHGKYGFSAEFIAGIAANWVKEAQLDPTASEPMQSGVEAARKATGGQLGIGWGQWSFERHTALVKHAESLGKDWWEPEAQLDYMVKKDGMFVGILKELALNSGDDPIEEAVTFHDQWERSADSRATVMSDRGQTAKDVLEYMKQNGMDGAKDEDKINKINATSNGDSSNSEDGSTISANDDAGETTVTSLCGEASESDSEVSAGNGKLGESVKANGKSGKNITQNYEYSELPDKYKKYIKVPKFDTSYLDKPGNTYVGSGNKGQCTELTWAYMSQLWKKRQTTGDVGGSTDGNGNVIYKAYKNHGAKITKNPTVGYGFSSNPPYAGAGDASVGHTGVVVGVMPDGKWIMANYNVPPKAAPSRTLYYTVVDGTDGNIIFFSGIK
ncbi:phage tail tip lysozyme [Macrococcus carouselicus]|uniref:Amidase n=1 Tax=Macrococcus carouselicus TaxID=69969 RepID=A0A9Q8CGV0_9STAP|nr:phage tail tip lysozyme [Macrococcus carouselicus]TDL95519.1 amidase [Macrococcus carouselicus]